MSNEYKITYQGILFCGDSMDEVVQKVKAYAATGKHSETQESSLSKDELKKVNYWMSWFQKKAYEIEHALYTMWEREQLEHRHPHHTLVCEKCGNAFIWTGDCESPSVAKPRLCSSCDASNEEEWIQKEVGIKINTIFQTPYYIKPIGVDEYSDRSFHAWYQKHYGNRLSVETDWSTHTGDSYVMSESTQWIKDRIQSAIDKYLKELESSADKEKEELYTELAKCYCVIHNYATAETYVRKWLGLIKLI